jgi:hypothetical protein
MSNKIFLLWIGYALLVGIAAGGSIVSAFITPPSTSSLNCAENPNGANCQSAEQRHEANEAALGYYTKWLMIGTAVLAFATIALGIATVGLYVSGERQFGLARDEFISTHRPKLVVRQFQIDPTSPGQPLRVTFSVINVGSTDATVRSIAGEVVIWNTLSNHYLEPGIDPVLRPIQNTILKSGTRSAFTAQSRFLFQQSHIGAVQTASYQIRCLGEIAYADGLGVLRRTGFHRRYDIANDKFLRSDDPDEEYCD